MVILRAWRITEPFIWPFDTAFQESLALSHLDYGLGITHGIAGFGFFHGRFLHHAAHPPLLQLIYAGLYGLFGAHEWVSRSVSCILALGTAICLWMTLIKIGARRAAFVAALFFAVLPLSVEMGRTTNYEPGALFFISLFTLGYTLRKSRSVLVLMVLSAFIGGFFEWTVYLVIPAVGIAALIEERSIRNLKFLIAPALLAGLVLATVLIWQESVVGLIPMLGHAQVRSNPRALFDPAAWYATLSYPIRGVGWGWLLVLLGLYRLKDLHRNVPQVIPVLVAFATVPLLFLLLAPQLVLSHPLASLYVVPAISILLGITVEGGRRIIIWMLLALLVIYFLWSDVKLLNMRSDFLYNLAQMTAEKIGYEKNCKVYDSTAVGYLRYYYGIETFHSVGADEPPVEEFIADENVCAFIADVSHPEVGYVADAVRRAASGGKLTLGWRLHGVEAWFRHADDGVIHLANLLGQAELPPVSKRFWENPTAEMVTMDGKSRFGILHQSRPEEKSVIIFKDIPALPGSEFRTIGRLETDACNRMATDGVSLMVKVFSKNWSQFHSQEIIPHNGKCEPVPFDILIMEGSGKVNIELTVMPRGNAAFDRLFWDDPLVEPPHRGRM